MSFLREKEVPCQREIHILFLEERRRKQGSEALNIQTVKEWIRWSLVRSPSELFKEVVQRTAKKSPRFEKW
jgi:hypothetical protein